MLDILLSFTISFLIGSLIGLEREHSHTEGLQPIGIRSFILFALLGTLIAILNQPILTTAISAFIFSIILLGYFRSTAHIRKKVGICIKVFLIMESNSQSICFENITLSAWHSS